MSMVTGTDLAAEQARSYAVDEATAALNQRYLEQGLWTQDQYQLAVISQAAGNASTGTNDVTGSVTDEAIAGLQQGYQNVLNAPGKVVSAVTGGAGTLLWGIVKAIPWWLWLSGAAALFVWMGGLEILKGSLDGFKRKQA